MANKSIAIKWRNLKMPHMGMQFYLFVYQNIVNKTANMFWPSHQQLKGIFYLFFFFSSNYSNQRHSETFLRKNPIEFINIYEHRFDRKLRHLESHLLCIYTFAHRHWNLLYFFFFLQNSIDRFMLYFTNICRARHFGRLSNQWTICMGHCFDHSYYTWSGWILLQTWWFTDLPWWSKINLWRNKRIMWCIGSIE